MPTAIIALVSPGPRTASTVIATRNPGSAIITSTTRPIAESNRPPRYPAIIPSTVPIPAPIATSSAAATSDTRAP